MDKIKYRKNRENIKEKEVNKLIKAINDTQIETDNKLKELANDCMDKNCRVQQTNEG